eukprot:356539-Chlamydomonas_euryale.AAC.7
MPVGMPSAKPETLHLHMTECTANRLRNAFTCLAMYAQDPHPDGSVCAWFVGNMVHEVSGRTQSSKHTRTVRPADEDEPDIEDMAYTIFQ